MKSKQFCSVCKEWLDMEVVPTGDGDDDGVIWYRCPQCQGFLPKLSSGDSSGDSPSSETAESTSEVDVASAGADDDMPFDSPAEMMAARAAEEKTRAADQPVENDGVEGGDPSQSESDSKPEESTKSAKSAKPSEPVEPIAEYAAQLEAALAELPVDQTGCSPYRPWESYEVGNCIQHLAWEDCGIVVAKEELPGGRRVIKVFFQEAGVVRLIEQAPQ